MKMFSSGLGKLRGGLGVGIVLCLVIVELGVWGAEFNPVSFPEACNPEPFLLNLRVFSAQPMSSTP